MTLTAKDWLLSPHELSGFIRFEPRAHEVRGSQIHHTEYLHVCTPKRHALVNATEQIEEVIRNLAPYGLDYRHHQTGEDNADAHLRSFLANHALTAPITSGRIDFGTWQQIFYAEFDGERDKRILIKVIGVA